MTQPTKPSLNVLPLKERMKVPRQAMPEQPAELRSTCFTEVNLGYSPEVAQQEALRCLECAKPACTVNCPVGVKVREFVELIVAGDFLAAAAKIREDNVLPAIEAKALIREARRRQMRRRWAIVAVLFVVAVVMAGALITGWPGRTTPKGIVPSSSEPGRGSPTVNSRRRPLNQLHRQLDSYLARISNQTSRLRLRRRVLGATQCPR